MTLDSMIRRGRSAKVSAILSAIPHGATTEDIARIADEHAAMSRKQVIALCKSAGARPPSVGSPTWPEVIDALRSRVPDPFAGEEPIASTERVVVDFEEIDPDEVAAAYAAMEFAELVGVGVEERIAKWDSP